MQSKNWRQFVISSSELVLDHTLPTGQTFRWRRTPSGFIGVVKSRVVQIKQTDSAVHYRILARGPSAAAADDASCIEDYFNLKYNLPKMQKDWLHDARFKVLLPYLPGARVLRQDPLECLFEFICSQNNHISRIHKLVEGLCVEYGTELVLSETAQVWLKEEMEGGGEWGGGGGEGDGGGEGKGSYQEAVSPLGLSFFSFPSVAQLAGATEAKLREAGFGYRAKYIVDTVAILAGKDGDVDHKDGVKSENGVASADVSMVGGGGGRAWLEGLRNSRDYEYVIDELCSLKGVGRKVAACVALFSCDQHQAIPIDVHMYRVAQKYYAPQLRNKTLTPKTTVVAESALQQAFGKYAGWAHNTLFIAELKHVKHKLPPSLNTAKPRASPATSDSDRDQDARGDDSDSIVQPGSANEKIQKSEMQQKQIKQKKIKSKQGKQKNIQNGAESNDTGPTTDVSQVNDVTRTDNNAPRSKRARKVQGKARAIPVDTGMVAKGEPGGRKRPKT